MGARQASVVTEIEEYGSQAFSNYPSIPKILKVRKQTLTWW